MRRTLTLLLTAAAVLAGQTPRELIEGGHYKRALAALGGRTPDAESLYCMASIKQAAGELEAAEKLAERAVAANPKEAQYHYRLSDITGQRAEKASVFHQIGLGKTFKKECDVALSLNPDHPGALMNMMEFYLHAPGIIGGDKTKARGIADHLAKLDPFQGLQAQIEIAAAAKDQNRIDELQHKLAEMRAETFDAHLMVGNYMAGGKAKRYDEAERHAREAIRLKPDRVAGHALLAAALVRLDKWQELDAALAQAEKDDADNLWPYYRAGNNLLDRKIDLQRAERYFRKYLTQEPEMRMPSLGAAHWRLSLVLEQEGRKPESASEWQTAQKLDPSLKKK